MVSSGCIFEDSDGSLKSGGRPARKTSKYRYLRGRSNIDPIIMHDVGDDDDYDYDDDDDYND